jgi:biotin synthase-related radical SAM superfamily protein
MIDKIIEMLNRGEYFINIFKELGCSDKEFIEALQIQTGQSPLRIKSKTATEIVVV